MAAKPIRVIVTGGTFDKLYDEIRGELTFKESALPEILKLVRVDVPVETEMNQLIDSLHMQDVNRASVAEACQRATEECIIITHGTDTMVETAAMIGRAGLEKTIVLTGAMVPYRVQGSDALFNFGSAFSAVQILPHGVWIAMSGRVFAWDAVRKNREKGRFEDIP
ncbi:MAG TPA: asparaginase domain-containing protein [Rectinemataceae bacterium]|nr:asparaginase domain-containing protein [Rectinemataceae bacterium]